LAVGVGLLLAAIACSKDPQPSVEAKAPPSMPESSPEAEAPPVAAPAEPLKAPAVEPSAPAKVAEESFELELKSNGTYRVGEPAAVQVVLVAKEPFKVNDEYPYSFSVVASEGVDFADM
jgi:hypothetical protein